MKRFAVFPILTALPVILLLTIATGIEPTPEEGPAVSANVGIASAPAAYPLIVEEGEAPVAVEKRPSAVAGFLGDRALDLCDLFRVRFHLPRGYRGVGFKGRATVLAQLGIIYFDGKSAGIDRRGVGIWRERRIEGGAGPMYVSSVRNEMIAGNRFTDQRRPWSRIQWRGIVRNCLCWDDGRYHPLSTGAELQLLVVGVEMETYPLEWLDAALGWIGVDSANDDESRILRRWDELQAVPELHVRDEWQEPALQKREIMVPAPKKTLRAEEKAPPAAVEAPPAESPIEPPPPPSPPQPPDKEQP